MPDNMHVWQIESFGGSEALRLVTIERPVPGAGEILVRIRATSVNPIDYKIRGGHFPPIGEAQLPIVLGRDVAGEVVNDGQGFQHGARVYGMPGFERGSLAEYVVMKPEQLALLPDGIDDATAGAVPLAALTAWQKLFDEGGLKAGERVLILGAPGGVGHFAVQFAKHFGARVFATGRAQDRGFLKDLGVEHMVDTETQSLNEIGGPADLVLDLVGGAAARNSLSMVKPGGRFVSALGVPDGVSSEHFSMARFMARADSGQLAEIAGLIEAGAVKPVIQHRFGFAEAPAAQDAVQQGHSRGKTVIILG